jgi:phospholipase C
MSYPEALTNAGVPWQVYQEVDNYECNLLEMFKSFQNGLVVPARSPADTMG